VVRQGGESYKYRQLEAAIQPLARVAPPGRPWLEASGPDFQKDCAVEEGSHEPNDTNGGAPIGKKAYVVPMAHFASNMDVS